MTSELVLRTHRGVFYRALLERDWDALADLYADDYMLVRSDGTLLSKHEVLRDLREGNLTFESIELFSETLRIVGPVALLTGKSLSKSRNGDVLIESSFRMVAVYVEGSGGLKLLHFQSTQL
jgi:ketosteroid isomerase-like protein